jgi:hypothetical protein
MTSAEAASVIASLTKQKRLIIEAWTWVMAAPCLQVLWIVAKCNDKKASNEKRVSPFFIILGLVA